MIAGGDWLARQPKRMLSRDLSANAPVLFLKKRKILEVPLLNVDLTTRSGYSSLRKLGKSVASRNPILDEEMKGIESLLLGHHAEL